MLARYLVHNRFKQEVALFAEMDPQLVALAALKYQYSPDWWKGLDLGIPGIYILTGGRQIGKSTSCKLLIKHCLENNLYNPLQIFYLPCDEIYDAKELGEILRLFLNETSGEDRFLLIIDEITFVKDWDRVIKALADEGHFTRGFCLLTGSDTIILKEAAMCFPGRRGKAETIDFHLYPLSFNHYVNLRDPNNKPTSLQLKSFFKDYLICGGYLRAINDIAEQGEISKATFLTYEQWIRGDLLKKGKNEMTLMSLLQALITVGVSTVSYSALTQKIGLMSKDTCIDYCHILERMDILIALQAFDQNKKQGFPRKDKKFHFTDPFILQTIMHWLKREGHSNAFISESMIVEACVASHCHRMGKTFYFKGQGEIDLIWLYNNKTQAIEVKWAEQIQSTDLKMLKSFGSGLILTKTPIEGNIETIQSRPVYEFLYALSI